MKNFNLQRLKEVIAAYPLVMLSAVLFFAFAFYMIEDFADGYESLGFIFSSAIPLFFGIKMLSKSVGKVWLLRLVGVLLLSLYFYILPQSEKDFNQVTALIVIPVYIFLHLFVAVARYWNRSDGEADFWNYNKNLFINFLTAGIFTAALLAGVLSVLFTCDELFQLDFKENFYLEMNFLIIIIGNTLIFLLFDYKTNLQDQKQGTYPVVLKFFTQYVLIPIMFLYTIVLYLYCIKILIVWELPQGWLSYGILSYAIVGILALLLVHPLREETQKSWVRWFYKLFFYSLLPLILLLFVAIFTRLLSYGFTEARYYVLALAIWLTLCTLYFILYQKASISIIPKSLMLLIVFALIFPYFNAFSVSIRSQKQEVQELLDENNLLQNKKINYAAEVKEEDIDELNNKYRFLHSRNEADFMLSYLDAAHLEKLEKNDYNTFVYHSEFENRIPASIESRNDQYVYIQAKNSLVEVRDHSYIMHPSNDVDEIIINQDTLRVHSTYDELKVSLNNSLVYDFSPAIKAYVNSIRATMPQDERRSNVEELLYTGKLPPYQLKVYFSDLSSYHPNEFVGTIQYIIIEENE